MFRFAAVVLSLVVGSANGMSFPNEIPANSRLGSRLMSEARALGGGNNNNNNYDFSWAVDYSIKYQGCNTVMQFNGANNGNGNNNNNKNNNKYSLVGTQTVVRFALCPTSETTCSACNDGGEYVVGIQNFIEQWTEAKENAKEYTCETIRATCDCEDAEDADSCEDACYTSAGHSECAAEEEEYPEDFELERYLECKELENKNGNNNNNNNNGEDNYSDDMYQNYYTGPYCGTDGYSIYLGIFADQYCSELLANKDSVYYNRYGATLPYSTKSLISKECLSCEKQNNNNNNNNNNGEASELCQTAYQYAAKCETNMKIDYPDTTGCTYIKNVLPRASLNTKVSSSESAVYRSSGSAGRVFAWLFAVSTIVLGAYAFFLYRKINRSKVDLSHSVDAALT